ncbi:MAG: CoA transferase [Deltaproteobacteria bacterium]|nr:CoA transferase [Deltaproteobacteria bacterium]MBW1818354.1 CoA transferase [Deltaproteobacteria bacterium]
MQILENVRVVDLAQFITGSRCTQILADMGAETVHVESPQGDTLRLIFKMLGDAERNYSMLNRNKYGMAVDWRKPRGRDLLLKILSKADIFVHNLIPGSLEKYGLGYEDVRKAKGDIIYVAISGFGTRSIKPERAAFDIIAQATSGQFWKQGDDLKPPTNHWADFMSGAYAALAALMGLIHKMNTGEGQFIDISMQDVLYFNNYRATVQKAMGPIMGDVEKALGRRPEDVLNSSDRMPFYGFFKASDGKVAIVAMTPRQWKDLTQIIGRPEMATDPRFENFLTQIHHHEAAVDFIDQWTSQHTSKEIIAALEEKKIPCGIASGLDEVNEDENLRDRGMFEKVRHAEFGEVDVPGVPYLFSRTPGAVRFAAPDLGEHNEFVLKKWLGCSADEIEGWKNDGTIVKP